MERESFEAEDVAEILNNNFVCIKVDREERPDVDHLYMSFCQALTGHGGWPLTVITTPEKKPFFAGTYFPKEGKWGMPGIKEILQRINDLWHNKREMILDEGEKITQAVENRVLTGSEGEIKPAALDEAYLYFEQVFDSKYGGFGSAPKFPTPSNLLYLLRYGVVKGKEKSLEMVEKTLEQMYRGGIFDHIGFGFSRYATDRRWLIPHFEKMLYDNALLAIVYLEAYQITGRLIYREVVEKIFTYILRDMVSDEGAFYSAEDADSEGEEGKYYLWTPAEIKDILGDEEGEEFCRRYDVTEEGNFEGKNIVNIIDKELLLKGAEQEQFERAREKLLHVREKRVHPYKDDKILTSWNALMITGLAIGARVLDEKKYLSAAEKALDFIFTRLRREDGRLLARFRKEESAYPAYLQDYAYLGWALLELYETTYEPKYLQNAISLSKEMLDIFWDSEQGGMFMSGHDAEKLLLSAKEIYDGALPSGNSIAVQNMLRLAGLTAEPSWEEKAKQTLAAFGGEINANPPGYTQILQAYLFALSPRKEIIIVGTEDEQETNKMINEVQKRYLPHAVHVFVPEEHKELLKVVPFAENFTADEGHSKAYVCENYACRTPVFSADDLAELL